MKFWEEMPPHEYYKHFRMSKQEFNFILEYTREFIEKQDTRFRKAIPVDKRLAIGLYTLASASEYRGIAALFGVSKQSVMRCFKDMVYAILRSRLVDMFMKLPTVDEL